MALDLTGIENVDFYSGHYLEAVLEGDLKAQFARWNQEKDDHARRLPWDALAALANPFFEMKARAENERSAEDRLSRVRDFHARLLEALGYERRIGAESVDDESNEVCPVALAANRDGHPFLWVIETPWPAGESTTDGEDDPLAAKPDRSQLPAEYANLDPCPLVDATWRELLDERIFRLERSPRFVLVLAGREVILVERGKWAQGRHLRFDLGALFARREAKALRAVAGLLHREVLCPDDGVCLHDTLDENSHKHAFAVSADLKRGLRRAVELIGNEAVWYRRNVQRALTMSDDELAAKLTPDCLNWLYRLLFLFYVEARGGELGVAPMKSEAYRRGYSLESLRDLELVPLTTEPARNGYFLHHSLAILFRIVNEGFGSVSQVQRVIDDPIHGAGSSHGMALDGLHSPLFDDDRFTVLKGVKFRNFVLQEVLQLLSLSAEKRGRTRGRISYASLGINQLGAVYEGILSYRGFFAHGDLFEVAKASDVASGEAAKEDTRSYFVPESRAHDYEDGEFVKDAEGRRIRHPKGSFLFRLAGRDREKSASYYTPEVLTRCLVKYSLKELLENEDGTRKLNAAQILELTICEPAMGSGAFLNEAVDQLADHYLSAVQEERRQPIPSEDYPAEKRKVKARLASNNCYGVDLNPIAAELAKVSLWLATMRSPKDGGKCPWFGLRLAIGNSLIGARRQIYRVNDLTRAGTKTEPNWLGLVPEWVKLFAEPLPGDATSTRDARVRSDESWRAPPRPRDGVWHFLVPAEGMAAFDGEEVVKSHAPEAARAIKAWRKTQSTPFSETDAKRLLALSESVDRLFEQVVRERSLAARDASDLVPVLGEPDLSANERLLRVRDQEEVQLALEASSSAYRRLKLVMDYWCALWFWPIEHAAALPTREQWLRILELVLRGRVTVRREQASLFPMGRNSELANELGAMVMETVHVKASETDADRASRLRELSDRLTRVRGRYAEECGLADVEEIVKTDPSLAIATQVAERHRFHHWELRFAEVFAERGGFDLILGNPPWIKLQWQEAGILSDLDPRLEIRDVSASNVAEQRNAQLSDRSVQHAYFDELVEMGGAQAFLNEEANYPLLKGVQTNSFKCFVTRAWENGSSRGASGFLHPEGVYDDPRGGPLREALYPRLRHHYQFINEHHLFPEVHNLTKYGVNVYGAPRSAALIWNASNLYHPITIDESWSHDGHGTVPGVKDEEDHFCARGHRRRIVRVDDERLGLFAALYDDAGTPPRQARLPVIHSEEIVEVLRKFAAQPRRLGDLREQYFATVMFDETYSQQDGTLRRETRFPKSVDEWILQGPHFYVGTPLYQTPNEGCDSNRAYTRIDLESIADDYLPRTNYVPACDPATYRDRTPKWKGRPVTEFYRYANRTMVSPTGERTLVCALFPPRMSHVDLAFSVAMEDHGALLDLLAMAMALPVDFLVKTTGKSHVRSDVAVQIPMPQQIGLAARMRAIALRLNALTSHYAGIWNSCLDDIRFAKRLGSESRDRRITPIQLDRERGVIRGDLSRRYALIEVDVLAAISLELNLEELIAIYRVQFPVLQQYERENLYDQHGRLVPTSLTASGNPAVSLVKLAELLHEQAGFDIHRDYRPSDPDLADLKAKPIRLSRRDAAVLGVDERCRLGDLLAETECRFFDADHPDGYTVTLVGLRYTDPGLEPRKERVYPTPWTRHDREADYRTAWAEFERLCTRADKRQ